MTTAKFQLRSVFIEGFKGFTSPQTITFTKRHAFLFGKNFSGKSSVVEAIRWCLFGLAERPEREVRNAYYASGECQVTLELQASDGIWRVQRRLRPGADRSRLAIINPSGQDVPQSQVFPFLARMGPKEGTHIIFAAQQASGRRPQADISDFHKVLYSHLHLEEAPDLLERLDKLLEEQQSVREDAASKISDIEESLKEKLGGVNLSLEELLRNPPWGEGAVPTRAESEAKIRSFAVEMAKLANKSLTPEISPGEALEQAEQWSQVLASTSQEELEKNLNAQQEKVNVLRNLLQTVRQAEKSQTEAQESIEQLSRELGHICRGQTLAELKEQVKLLSEQMMETDAKLAIVREAEKYCKAYSVQECPVCLAEYTVDDLLKKAKYSLEQATPQQAALAKELEDLKARCEKAFTLNTQLQESTTKDGSAKEQRSNALAQIYSLLEVSESSELNEQDIESRLTALESSVETLKNSLSSAESLSSQWRKRIEDLRTELRFHKYREQQQNLQWRLTLGLQPVRQDFQGLVDLEESVRKIKEVLVQVFNEVMDRALPPLSSMMTEVYCRLTGQPSFEKVQIQRVDGLVGQSLQVRVGSDRIPGQLFNPEDVLNGQAISALQLVPYFVFSQFQAETLELDLLLIDDPSQSFDTSHVELLLQELATAGSHAQLIVATHEEERFGPQLGRYFPKDTYELIQFKEFDPDKGPSFAIE
jgi:predicted ATP-dependent endonuclease of OLD family